MFLHFPISPRSFPLPTTHTTLCSFCLHLKKKMNTESQETDYPHKNAQNRSQNIQAKVK